MGVGGKRNTHTSRVYKVATAAEANVRSYCLFGAKDPVPLAGNSMIDTDMYLQH